uniref:Ig-like domain-containing protein n=1 Tax=Chromera velia CCMP2878 TaxID=1169474 RepID=A0A0G4HA87_9ALVE|eukprot:Cvel_6071.t1-p1 / transcript=Cvel_6071.t1 / gene=Cvel_6071 / organism=Chromera_velia_CCMP2878 / gene_product=hypothetical protein / transcript_product=hypothetical protein / location=Cvel_scaffold292:13763-14383(-) / protein_length=207 / sequence_SO=supercontig / SO=protein_coding / is_pseudo=false
MFRRVSFLVISLALSFLPEGRAEVLRCRTDKDPGSPFVIDAQNKEAYEWISYEGEYFNVKNNRYYQHKLKTLYHATLQCESLGEIQSEDKDLPCEMCTALSSEPSKMKAAGCFEIHDEDTFEEKYECHPDGLVSFGVPYSSCVAGRGGKCSFGPDGLSQLMKMKDEAEIEIKKNQARKKVLTRWEDILIFGASEAEETAPPSTAFLQ